ncbi:MAG: hypothetical protein U5J62_06710 [Desulfurivibrio sp.]|nr:hypothetical protein [Desulfurivibrio sp.]
MRFELSSTIEYIPYIRQEPTYVAVWTEDKANITVEIIYAGTHEKAPY